jgi:sulfonate transport system substrate-binding protein
MNSSRGIFCAGAVAFGLVALAAPGRAAEMEHTSLAIPGITLGFLSRYIAEDEHLWEKQGLDVKVIHIQGIGSMNAVISGSVDFSMSSGPSITRATARGRKLVALATAQNQSDEDIVIRKDIAEAKHFDPHAPLAERAKVLKGLTIAVGGVGAIPDIILKAVAREGGIGRDEVIATPLQPEAIMAAFAQKKLDGFVSGPPYIQQVVLNGTGVILSDTTKGEPTRYSPVSSALLLTRAEFCKDHRPICTKMVHGIVEAIKFIHDHPKESIAVMKAHFGKYGDKVLEAAYPMVAALSPVSPATTPQMLENADLLNIAAGFITEKDKLPRYDDIIDNDFIK